MVMKGKQGKSLLSRMEWGKMVPHLYELWANPMLRLSYINCFAKIPSSNEIFTRQKLDIKIYEGEATLGKAWVDMNLTTSHYELLSLPSLFKHLSGTPRVLRSSLKSTFLYEMISIVPPAVQGAPLLVHSVQFISYNGIFLKPGLENKYLPVPWP